MTLITKGHGFPTDLDPDVNTVTLPAIEDGSHVLGAPSRDTRALARIRPESESRGEHRGIGKSAWLLSTETRELFRWHTSSLEDYARHRTAFHSCPCTVMGTDNSRQFPASAFPGAPPASVRTVDMAVVWE